MYNRQIGSAERRHGMTRLECIPALDSEQSVVHKQTDTGSQKMGCMEWRKKGSWIKLLTRRAVLNLTISKATSSSNLHRNILRRRNGCQAS